MLRSDDLLGIGMEADAVRKRLHPGNVVTYQIDRNVNYTNICTEYCSFCAFYQSFRRRAAEMLGVEPDWILCGNGSDDILTIVTRAFVGQGHCSGCRTPATSSTGRWPNCRARGRRDPLPARLVAGRRLPPRGKDLRLVFLPNPNSPSGTVLPPEHVLELADRLPCPLLVDEAYVDFADDHLPEAGGRNEKILVSRSLEQVVCVGRAAIRLFGGAAADHPTTD